ncbi:HET-domain-containing protein [Lophium mytilinum]|uniref:HET-domain-containing protein n=1 Tax=Lophium mytilinum TaxID=390894 RepID=A0A6A6QP25_9PEZI|nr:HET-domain-containing protein [Lophium mytilinum]
MSSIPSYEYQSLEPGDIRLLQLLPPNPRVQNDPIRFHIVHTSFARCNILDSFFSYEALSYVWGGSRTDPVYCNNREILVTPNLVSALSRLRKTMSKYPVFHRTLWVDSICINQNDVLERGHQVRLMRDIYSHASRVIIWLGRSRKVEDCLTRIKHADLELLSQNHIDRRSGARYRADWVISAAKIFDQPWFQRVWVIQEIVFAAKTIVLNGTASIVWDQLVNVAVEGKQSPHVSAAQRMRCDAVLGIECLRNQIREDGRSKSDLQLHSGSGYQSVLSERLKPALTSGTFDRLPKDLLELAELFRSYSATDPRDKIYAILGLALALGTDRLASHIDADYDLGTEDLFLGFARLVMSGPNALRLLRNLDGPREQPPGLPSWVPDWGRPLKIRPLAELCKPDHLLSSQRANILKQPSPDVLKLVGKHIDTIKAVGEVLNELSGDGGVKIWTSWGSLGQKHGSTPPEDFNWNAFSVPRSWRDYQLQRHYPIRLPPHYSEVCLGRRYLLSKQKRSGIAPAGATVGDEIILFPGAQLLSVVRQCDSSNVFYVIGECYLDRVSLDSLIRKKIYKEGIYSLI